MSDLSQPISGYEVLEQIGRGGMSTVYRAHHKGLDRYVAIKVLRRDQLDPGLALQRLMKEARVLSRLDHPNIVRSIDIGEAAERVWFVMELVEGQSCKQLLIDRGPFPLREVLLIGEKVALALGHAAAAGVVHRDVKPGNVLLAKDGAVKLTDFGLARATRDRSLTQDGITVGTPQYMSPEQVRSPRRVDLRSDLYSLGATLYHLVTGHPPLRGETVGEILHEVLYSLPKPPEQLVPGLPPGFSRLLARLLAKDPKRRYPSAEELVADLRRVRAAFTDPEADLEVGLSWQEAAEPPPKSRTGWWIAGAASVVATVALTLLWRGAPSGGTDWNDAKQREEAHLAQLTTEWRGGGRSTAELITRLDELKREGHFTPVSGLARADLLDAANGALQKEFAAATERARQAGRAELANGDFAAAHRVLDAELALAIESVVPEASRDRLLAAGVDARPWMREARANTNAELEDLERELRQRVRDCLSQVRFEVDEQVQTALEMERFGEARARAGEHAEREASACAEATAEFLRESGVTPAAETTEAEWRRGWPASVRDVIEQEPAASFVARTAELIDSRATRAGKNLLFELQEATRRAVAEVEEGREVDVAAVRSAFEAEHAAARQGLAEIGELPSTLDAAWSALAERVAGAREVAAAERHASARAELLAGAGARPGIMQLLFERRLDEARTALDAVTALPASDRANWTLAIDDLACTFAEAERELRERDGKAIDVRDRKGIGVRGRLEFAVGGRFSVGSRAGLRVEDLALPSLEHALSAAIAEEERRVVVRCLLGDEKERALIGAELSRLAHGAVVEELLREQLDQARVDANDKAQREVQASEWRAQLDAALAASDGAKARAAFKQLTKRPETGAGRAALVDRDRIEASITTLDRDARVKALLDRMAPNATVCALEPDGTARIEYAFDRSEEGEDWNVLGTALHVDNGRLFFVGGPAGRTGALYGATLEWPFDRRAPASMEVTLMPTLGEKNPPHYVALRFGAACTVFFRPVTPLGEQYDPQLAAWVGTLDANDWKPRFFDPVLDSEPKTGHVEPFGLDRGRRHKVTLSWLPDVGTGTVKVGVTVDGDRQFECDERLLPPSKKSADVVQICSLTELQVEHVVLRGTIGG